MNEKPTHIRLLFVMLTAVMFLFATRISNSQGRVEQTEVFVASTPCDSYVKSVLGIDDKMEVDFIRWELSLVGKSFTAKINFGVGQPNTSGFIGGGTRKELSGSVEESILSKTNLKAHILKSPSLQSSLLLVRLSSNILHILTSDKKLMTGNDGWSYSLNKEAQSTLVEPLPIPASPASKNESISVVYGGRTPCNPVNREYDLGFGDTCLKIKWRLEFFFDPSSHQPTKYVLNRTGHRSGPIEGKWLIRKGTESNPEAVIYQLNPDEPDKAITFLAADENILFFIDKRQQLMVGDENFSFTLNRHR